MKRCIHQSKFDRIKQVVGSYLADKTSFPSVVGEEVEGKALHNTGFDIDRLCIEWAGVDFKDFLQYTRVEYFRRFLNDDRRISSNLTFHAVPEKTKIGHCFSVEIEPIKPLKLTKKGMGLTINYCYTDSLFGRILIASTEKGICYLGFADDHQRTFSDLKNYFPGAVFVRQHDEIQQQALAASMCGESHVGKITLHVVATDFQQRVWQALLAIPFGRLRSYQNIAEQIGQPRAVRAVGSAIGRNPIALLLPCHRVLQVTGLPGGYKWGVARKVAIIAWEAVQINHSMGGTMAP